MLDGFLGRFSNYTVDGQSKEAFTVLQDDTSEE